MGGELQCGGLRPLCVGLLGGSSVEEGVMEWMATITGDHVGYPGGFGLFFSKEKIFLGSENSHVFLHQNRMFVIDAIPFLA